MAGMACIPNIAVYNSVYVKTDYLAGLNFLKRGCDLRDSDSCYMVGGLYLSGVAPVIEADPAAAFHYDFKVFSNVSCCFLLLYVITSSPIDYRLACWEATWLASILAAFSQSIPKEAKLRVPVVQSVTDWNGEWNNSRPTYCSIVLALRNKFSWKHPWPVLRTPKELSDREGIT